MYINGENIEKYNARLLNLIIHPSDIKINDYWDNNGLEPIIHGDFKTKYKKMILKLRLKGTVSSIERNKSNLIKELCMSTIKVKELDGFYRGTLTSHDIDNKVNGSETISIEMKVIHEEEQKNINFNKNNNLTLYVGGNDTSPAIIEITPSVNVSTVNITGLGEEITLNNLTVNNKVIIDGVKGLITENSENKFPDYDSWGFPKLEPGENNIFVDNDTLDIVIKYNPRWI